MACGLLRTDDLTHRRPDIKSRGGSSLRPRESLLTRPLHFPSNCHFCLWREAYLGKVLSIANEVVFPVIYIGIYSSSGLLKEGTRDVCRRCRRCRLLLCPKGFEGSLCGTCRLCNSSLIRILVRRPVFRAHSAPPPSYLRVTSAFGEKHCRAVVHYRNSRLTSNGKGCCYLRSSLIVRMTSTPNFSFT